MTLLELARKLRPYIEKAALSLSDEDALEAVDLFPRWDVNHGEYLKDDKVKFEGDLYRCLQQHFPQAGWAPTLAPSLWARVLIPDENVIPEWEQPGSTNPYMKGDRVMFNEKVYESAIDNNIWSPADYPAGWVEVSI